MKPFVSFLAGRHFVRSAVFLLLLICRSYLLPALVTLRPKDLTSCSVLFPQTFT